MGILAVNEQYGIVSLVDVGQQWHIDERKSHRGVPCTIRIDGTGVKSTFSLVIIEVVFDELRLVALDASGQTGRTGSGRAVLCITGPDSIHRLAFVAAYFGTVLRIEIAVGIHGSYRTL